MESQLKVEDTKQAMEVHICLGTIATGILTIIAFIYNRKIWQRYPGWLRTVRGSIPSIAVIKETLAQDLPAFLRRRPDLSMCSIINERQREDKFLYDVFEIEEGLELENVS